MSVSLFPFAAGVSEELCVVDALTIITLSLSLSQFLSVHCISAVVHPCIAPGLCLFAPPLPFFSTLNEAYPRLHSRADCTLLTLFSHDFPPERGVPFDLICSKSSNVIKSACSVRPGPPAGLREPVCLSVCPCGHLSECRLETSCITKNCFNVLIKFLGVCFDGSAQWVVLFSSLVNFNHSVNS